MKKLLIAAPLALAAAGVLAAPASAATWHNPGQIRAEIAQLDRQVDRARGLSPREEQRLDRQVNQLQSLYRTYARNGFSRGELTALDRRIDRLRSDLFKQSHDWNGRYDRHR